MEYDRLIRKADNLCRLFKEASSALREQRDGRDSPKFTAIRRAEIWLEGNVLGLSEEIEKYHAEKRNAGGV